VTFDALRLGPIRIRRSVLDLRFLLSFVNGRTPLRHPDAFAVARDVTTTAIASVGSSTAGADRATLLTLRARYSSIDVGISLSPGLGGCNHQA
jgi:hypothetical protein